MGIITTGILFYMTPSKVVILVRHGEAEHNVDYAYLKQRNTSLTLLGKQQATSAHRAIQKLAPEVVVTSPLLRTLQTTEGMLRGDGASSSSSRAVVVHPDAREKISNNACNLPIDPDALAALSDGGGAFASYDWTLVREAVAAAGGIAAWEQACAAEDDKLRERCERFTTWLETGLTQQRVCVVSHGEYLRQLPSAAGGAAEPSESMMDNCEVRIFTLRDGSWTRQHEPS